MSYVYASFLGLFLLAALSVNLLGLPGNWILFGLACLYAWLIPGSEPGPSFYLWLAGLAALGEAVEFAGNYLGAKRAGGSTQGNIGSIIGAIAGAILMVPLFFGFGALLGALLGAYLGCLAMERLNGRDMTQAHQAALGALYGKALGLTAKLGLGAGMLVFALRALWPK